MWVCLPLPRSVGLSATGEGRVCGGFCSVQPTAHEVNRCLLVVCLQNPYHQCGLMVDLQRENNSRA